MHIQTADGTKLRTYPGRWGCWNLGEYPILFNTALHSPEDQPDVIIFDPQYQEISRYSFPGNERRWAWAAGGSIGVQLVSESGRRHGIELTMSNQTIPTLEPVGEMLRFVYTNGRDTYGILIRGTGESPLIGSTYYKDLHPGVPDAIQRERRIPYSLSLAAILKDALAVLKPLSADSEISADLQPKVRDALADVRTFADAWHSQLAIAEAERLHDLMPDAIWKTDGRLSRKEDLAVATWIVFTDGQPTKLENGDGRVYESIDYADIECPDDTFLLTVKTHYPNRSEWGYTSGGRLEISPIWHTRDDVTISQKRIRQEQESRNRELNEKWAREKEEKEAAEADYLKRNPEIAKIVAANRFQFPLLLKDANTKLLAGKFAEAETGIADINNAAMLFIDDRQWLELRARWAKACLESVEGRRPWTTAPAQGFGTFGVMLLHNFETDDPHGIVGAVGIQELRAKLMPFADADRNRIAQEKRDRDMREYELAHPQAPANNPVAAPTGNSTLPTTPPQTDKARKDAFSRQGNAPGTTPYNPP